MAARLELAAYFLARAANHEQQRLFTKRLRERVMGVHMKLAEPCSLSVTGTINQRIAGANVVM